MFTEKPSIIDNGAFTNRVQESDKLRIKRDLQTMSMNELLDTAFPTLQPVIENLLYPGIYILAGAPKVGKSFLVAQIAYHISTGKPLWDLRVQQDTVLYLSLEDNYQRLQERVSRMFGVEGTDRLHFCVCAEKLGEGLLPQLDSFVKSYPDTHVIIIDTLQKIRLHKETSYHYAEDYDIVGHLKKYADARGLCILLVHHTRKQQADDVFEMISGTSGLLGCADGAMILQKKSRSDLEATLDVVGRDQADQRLYLLKDPEHLTWVLDHMETELWKPPPDPMLDKLSEFLLMKDLSWEGSAAELAESLGGEWEPNILTRRLNVKSGELEKEYGIQYHRKRTRYGCQIYLQMTL